MEYIHIDSPILSYPVGNDLEAAIEYATGSAEAFLALPMLKSGRSIKVWCRGSSGAILAALFIQACKARSGKHVYRINHVKKPGESSHSDNDFYKRAEDVNVIIDDFISTGDTLNSIYEASPEDIDVLIIQGAARFRMSRLIFTPEYVISNTSPFKEDT